MGLIMQIGNAMYQKIAHGIFSLFMFDSPIDVSNIVKSY
jgi:hypothetical protein